MEFTYQPTHPPKGMTTRPKRIDGLEIREVEDGFMVYPSGGSRVHYLNHTAVLVLELCNGRRSAADIAEQVRKAFGLSTPPRQEVDDVLAQMTGQGLVAGRLRSRRPRRSKPTDKLRHFPHLLWINLDREESRKAYMENQLKPYAFPHTRISAYDGSSEDLTQHLTHPHNRCNLSNPEIGATISHLKAIKYFLDHLDAEHVVIAEDDLDLSICQFWDFDWDYVVAHLPYDWDVVQLAIICWPQYLITKIHPRQPHDWSAACYLLSRHHARKLIALHHDNGKCKIDNGVTPKPFADEIVYHSGKTYAMPLFLYNLDFRSAIHQEDVKNIQTQSRRAVYEWWSKRSAHIDQETLFLLDVPLGPPSRSEAPRASPLD